MGPLTLHNISEAHMSGQYCFKRTFLTDFACGISVSNIIQGLFLGKHTIEKFCDSKGRCKMWRQENISPKAPLICFSTTCEKYWLPITATMSTQRVRLRESLLSLRPEIALLPIKSRFSFIWCHLSTILSKNRTPYMCELCITHIQKCLIALVELHLSRQGCIFSRRIIDIDSLTDWKMLNFKTLPYVLLHILKKVLKGKANKGKVRIVL